MSLPTITTDINKLDKLLKKGPRNNLGSKRYIKYILDRYRALHGKLPKELSALDILEVYFHNNSSVWSKTTYGSSKLQIDTRDRPCSKDLLKVICSLITPDIASDAYKKDCGLTRDFNRGRDLFYSLTHRSWQYDDFMRNSLLLALKKHG